MLTLAFWTRRERARESERESARAHACAFILDKVMPSVGILHRYREKERERVCVC